MKYYSREQLLAIAKPFRCGNSAYTKSANIKDWHIIIEDLDNIEPCLEMNIDMTMKEGEANVSQEK